MPTNPQFSLKKLGQTRYYLAVHQGSPLIADGGTRAGILTSAGERVAIAKCAKESMAVTDFQMRQQGDRGWVSVVGGFSCIALTEPRTKPTAESSKSMPPNDAADPAPGTRIGSGSGFSIDRRGTIVTNFHVIEKCSALSVVTGRSEAPATVLAADRELDLAALRTTPSPTAAPAIRSARSDKLGESIVVAGYPLGGILGSGLNVTTGSVSALSGVRNTTRFLQFTAPVHLGNSGGPLLDESGNVAGVVVAKLHPGLAGAFGDTPQNVNFAIKSSVLRGFLETNGLEYTEATASKRLSTVEIAERAQSFTVHVICLK
ncbi:serine protease [Variovorax sp. J22R24]|uniref:S1C family serine protease n=1 Tax=Variovorax gracilis TaxID=3053502 RepID=UPI002574FFC8|nr:serine protease [Variovorax sp. J22R24]MDM0110225.1 serine protease [Variovorax sp. J22R24]